MRTYVKIKINLNCSRRTKERFSRFNNIEHRIELINRKINESLKGDGFFIGEPMTYFGVDIYKNGLWARAWEGWIPDDEIEVEVI